MPKMFKYKKENRIYWFSETGLKVLQQHQHDSDMFLAQTAEYIIDVAHDRQSMLKCRGSENLEKLIDSQCTEVVDIKSTLKGPDVQAIRQIIGMVAYNPKSFHLLNVTMEYFKISVNYNRIELKVPHKFVQPIYEELYENIVHSIPIHSTICGTLQLEIPANDPNSPKLCLAVSSENF